MVKAMLCRLSAVGRPFAFLGRISYCVYLIHYSVLPFFKQTDIPPAAKLLLSFVVTTAIASVSFHFFEAPIGSRIRRLALPPG